MNSVYISCNNNYARDLKIEPYEIKGKTDFDFFPKTLAEKYLSDDNRVINSGNEMEIEESYIQNGQTKYVFTIKTPVRDEKGVICGVLGIFNDISKFKRIENNLRVSEKRLSDIALSSVDLIWEIDINGKYTFASGNVERILGYRSEDLTGKSIFDLMDIDERMRTKTIFEKIVSDKKPCVDIETWVLTRYEKKSAF